MRRNRSAENVTGAMLKDVSGTMLKDVSGILRKYGVIGMLKDDVDGITLNEVNGANGVIGAMLKDMSRNDMLKDVSGISLKDGRDDFDGITLKDVNGAMLKDGVIGTVLKDVSGNDMLKDVGGIMLKDGVLGTVELKDVGKDIMLKDVDGVTLKDGVVGILLKDDGRDIMLKDVDGIMLKDGVIGILLKDDVDGILQRVIIALQVSETLSVLLHSGRWRRRRHWRMVLADHPVLCTQPVVLRYFGCLLNGKEGLWHDDRGRHVGRPCRCEAVAAFCGLSQNGYGVSSGLWTSLASRAPGAAQTSKTHPKNPAGRPDPPNQKTTPGDVLPKALDCTEFTQWFVLGTLLPPVQLRSRGGRATALPGRGGGKGGARGGQAGTRLRSRCPVQPQNRGRRKLMHGRSVHEMGTCKGGAKAG